MPRNGMMCRGWLVAMMAMGVMCSGIRAQKPTDASVLASPTTAPPKAPVVDGAVEASPAPGGTKRGAAGPIAVGTELRLQMSEALDSGTLKNGQTVNATLTAAVKAGAVTLPAGTKVTLSVVGAVPANKISSAGEMSLQVATVGTMSVYTDTQTVKGQEGHKDVADSSPQKGTDATLAAGAVLTFHVQPDPTTTMPGVVK